VEQQGAAQSRGRHHAGGKETGSQDCGEPSGRSHLLATDPALVVIGQLTYQPIHHLSTANRKSIRFSTPGRDDGQEEHSPCERI
jgi:hypothetical protein